VKPLSPAVVDGPRAPGRRAIPPGASALSVPPFVCDPETCVVTTAHGSADLGRVPFAVFRSIAAVAPRCKNYERIIADVWGEKIHVDTKWNCVKVHASNLRKQLRPIGLEIEADRPRGYRLVSISVHSNRAPVRQDLARSFANTGR
jgi:DNA-binding response OmpR family regulator